MRPLTASEAADIARVCQHPRFQSISCHPKGAPLGRWLIGFVTSDGMPTWTTGRTLRACIRAAVRWIEENP